MEMASTRGTENDKSLDDSLTNIQWLCGLESSEILHSRENSAQGSIRDSNKNVIAPNSPNPYPKPPYSYATMILLAINSTEDKRMTLQDIYKWIESNYPYYQKCKKAWKNSIRHNLSLHSFFLKEKRPVNLPGKGSYWSISPEGKKNIMREVMKHAQPVVQNTLAQTGLAGRNLRPILPKPSEDYRQQHSSNVEGIQTAPPNLLGVCSFVNGNNNVMPVVILPTNVYEELASKIAGKKKNEPNFTVTQGVDSSIQISHESNIPPEQHVNQSKTTGNSSFNEPAVSALLEEIWGNKSFSDAFDAIKNEGDINEVNTKTTQSSTHVSEDCDYKPQFKKVKIEGEKENKSSDLFQSCSTPQVTQDRTPFKDRTLPTLAAMNSTQQESGNIFDKEKIHDMNSLMLSPVQLSTPRGPVITTNSLKLLTPAQSSPLSSSAFRSGLTPLKYDSDSGFFTPLKESDFDFLLSPNNLNFRLTPARMNTPQGCRKSLKLGALQEEDASSTNGISWM